MRDGEVGLADGAQPSFDHLPRLQPVRQRDHGVVPAQGCARPGGHGLRGRHPGLHRDLDARVLGVLGRFEDGRGHAEHPGVAAGDDRNPGPAQRQVEGLPGAVELDGVARFVPGQAGAHGNPLDVRAVADDVVDLGQHSTHLGGQPPVRSGSETDDVEVRPPGQPGRRPRSPGGVRAPVPPRDDDHREVGHGTGIDVGHGAYGLRPRARPLDVARLRQPARLPQGLDDGREGAPQLHDRGRLGVGQPPGELGDRKGPGEHGEHVLVTNQRGRARGRRRGDRGDPGHDLAREAAGQPVVQVHVGAVEQRIALGQDHHVATGVQMGGQPVGRRVVEGGHRAVVAARVVALARRSRGRPGAPRWCPA